MIQDLSFDADNPFVRTEISGILARGPQNKQRDSGVSLEEALMAYEEIIIPTPELPDSTPAVVNLEDASATEESPEESFGWLRLIVGVVTSIGLGTLFAVYLSRRRGA